MFDILGFKALRARLGTEGLYNLYSQVILADIAHAHMPKFDYSMSGSGRLQAKPDPASKRADCLLFSDTIIYWTVDDSYESFINIVFTALELLKSSFVPPRVPIRGAIATGDLISDEQGVIVGSAVENAYKGEQSQVWAGCMLTSETASFCEQAHYIVTFHEYMDKWASNVQDTSLSDRILKFSRALVAYPVPLRKNVGPGQTKYFDEERYVLDWTQQVYAGAMEKAFMEPQNDRQKMIQDNTRKFEGWARSRY